MVLAYYISHFPSANGARVTLTFLTTNEDCEVNETKDTSSDIRGEMRDVFSQQSDRFPISRVAGF